jgi:predicted transcriptional regulator
MTKQTEQTEAVKIRLGCDDKTKLQEIAEKEFRTFTDQCRLALHEWLEAKAKRPAR